MHTDRVRQLRLERKRRRRVERKKERLATRDCGGGPRLEEVWSHTAVLVPAGGNLTPERLAAHAGLGRMSDALLRLLEPYVWWPPTKEEIPELQGWLELGAAVWNATNRAGNGAALHRQLAAIADAAAGFADEDPVELVEELAERKLRLFANDYRIVGLVTVRENDRNGNAEVEALSLSRLP